MKKKKVSKIPKFKTLEEEAKFWDTHSITDFEDELEEIELVFDLQRPKEKTLVLRLQKKIKARLGKVARNQGIGISALARMWILQKLQSGKA